MGRVGVAGVGWGGEPARREGDSGVAMAFSLLLYRTCLLALPPNPRERSTASSGMAKT